MLRKSLWRVFILYERKVNRQLFFEFDIFKKSNIPAGKIKLFGFSQNSGET
jgi:hypothetical protein